MLIVVGYLAASVAGIVACLMLCAIVAAPLVRRRLQRRYPELFERTDRDAVVYFEELQAIISAGEGLPRFGGLVRSARSTLIVTATELRIVPRRSWLMLALNHAMLVRMPRSAVEVVAADRQNNTVTLRMPVRGSTGDHMLLTIIPHDIEMLLVVLGKDRIF
ncbi:MAG TPA: hypothetical protein VHI13_19475 [Candidatus Kapabacteria bacterium]|nr:hypothetical protein [Candidatus Kapabacteria bacterium]